jgi:hypothetical protein
MIFFILLNIWVSVKTSYEAQRSDLSAFYYAAKVVLGNNIPNAEVYNLRILLSTSASYGISDLPMPFVYSIASAYIMSPIALIPYKEAKIVWSILGLIFYLGAIIIFLRIGKVSKLWFISGIIILLSWFPFAYSQIWLQTNSLLIFLIALSVLAAVKDRPFTSGFLIGIASIFKLFPLAFAVYLGLKNWRITAACVAVFIVSFLIPGSLEWVNAIKEIHPYGNSGINTPIYTCLNQYGYIWFFVYAVVVTGTTVLIIYLNKSADYLILISFVIPAAFLVNPYVDYHHLTILALSYAYIISKVGVLPRWFLVTSIISFAFVNACVLYIPYVNPISSVVMTGVFLLWINFSILFLSQSNYIRLLEKHFK